MNKVIRKHYPASKLPEELRLGFADDALVEVTVTEEAAPQRSISDLLEMARAMPISTTTGEAVERIRKLRDEWDD